MADSISTTGKAITTYELEFHRFILPEFLTHRIFSRNAASSRAIPVAKMIENIRNNPSVPLYWGKNQAGMQANEQHDDEVLPISLILAVQSISDKTHDEAVAFLRKSLPNGKFTKELAWESIMNAVILQAEEFAKAGYHKQIVNRLTEPFQMIKVVLTSTEFDNFFWLRAHGDAQPEIRMLAEAMWDAKQKSTPEILQAGEWHLPYVDTLREVVYKEDSAEEGTLGELVYYIGDLENPTFLSLEDAKKVSASMCAQVSYRKSDDSLEKALMIFDRLVESKPAHASPMEHQATPMHYSINSFSDEFREEPISINVASRFNTWEDGITSIHKQLGFMSGNFAGWIQHRQLLDGHTCWDFEGERCE